MFSTSQSSQLHIIINKLPAQMTLIYEKEAWTNLRVGSVKLTKCNLWSAGVKKG